MQTTARNLTSLVSKRNTVILLLATTLVTAAFLMLAPTERTLGAGIRSVYLHVALIWVGMAGLYLAGLLGAGVLATGRAWLPRWMEAIAWVSFLIYTLSGIVSLVAQEVNWGGISWREPRTVAMIQIVALGLIVRVLNTWFPQARLQALLNLLVAAILLWLSRAASLQLHPENAVGSTTAQTIRLSFFGLTALVTLVAAWLTVYWHAHRT